MLRTAFSQSYLLQQKYRWLVAKGLSRSGSKTLGCDVIFGVVSAGCRGNGVCKIVAIGEAARNSSSEHCRHACGILEASDQGRRLSLFLFKESLCPTLLRRQLSGPLFQVQEDFFLPMLVSRPLDLQITRIAAGWYPIERHDACFKICLTEK